MIRMTALMDDLASKNQALVSEHGLSYFIEAGDKRILFDCGQSSNTWRNAAALGLDIRELDAVVLSHSHYDHAGGCRSLIESGGGSPQVYTGQSFWEQKCSFDGTGCKDRSAGFDAGFLRNHGITQREVPDLAEISPGIWAVGDFPRINDFETIPQKYVRKTEAGFVWDDFRDEICLALDIGGGLAVLAGCSHPGIVNMVTRVQNALGMPVRAVFGGTHLLEATEHRICATLDALYALGVETIGLSHCSGSAAQSAAERDGRMKCCRLTVGDGVVLK